MELRVKKIKKHKIGKRITYIFIAIVIIAFSVAGTLVYNLFSFFNYSQEQFTTAYAVANRNPYVKGQNFDPGISKDIERINKLSANAKAFFKVSKNNLKSGKTKDFWEARIDLQNILFQQFRGEIPVLENIRQRILDANLTSYTPIKIIANNFIPTSIKTINTYLNMATIDKDENGKIDRSGTDDNYTNALTDFSVSFAQSIKQFFVEGIGSEVSFSTYNGIDTEKSTDIHNLVKYMKNSLVDVAASGVVTQKNLIISLYNRIVITIGESLMRPAAFAPINLFENYKKEGITVNKSKDGQVKKAFDFYGPLFKIFVNHIWDLYSSNVILDGINYVINDQIAFMISHPVIFNVDKQKKILKSSCQLFSYYFTNCVLPPNPIINEAIFYVKINIYKDWEEKACKEEVEKNSKYSLALNQTVSSNNLYTVSHTLRGMIEQNSQLFYIDKDDKNKSNYSNEFNNFWYDGPLGFKTRGYWI